MGEREERERGRGRGRERRNCIIIIREGEKSRLVEFQMRELADEKRTNDVGFTWSLIGAALALIE